MELNEKDLESITGGTDEGKKYIVICTFDLIGATYKQESTSLAASNSFKAEMEEEGCICTMTEVTSK